MTLVLCSCLVQSCTANLCSLHLWFVVNRGIRQPFCPVASSLQWLHRQLVPDVTVRRTLSATWLRYFVTRKLFLLLDRQILVLVAFSCLLSSLLQTPRKVRSHDRDIVSKSSYRFEEFAKQYKDAVNLDEEADQWPAKENEYDACDESSCALDLLTACEEEECALDTEK